MKATFCTSCGKSLSAGQFFCQSCGTAVEDTVGIARNKPSTSWFEKRSFWLGALVLVAAIAILSQDFSSEVPDPPPARLFPNRLDSQEKDFELALGDSASLNGVDVRSSFVTARKSVGEYWNNAGDGKTFLVFLIAVTNLGDRSTHISPYDYRLQTPAGKVIDSTFLGMEPRLDSVDLVPGGEMSGYVTFEVDAISGDHYLIWKPNPFSSARAIWGTVDIDPDSGSGASNDIVRVSQVLLRTGTYANMAAPEMPAWSLTGKDELELHQGRSLAHWPRLHVAQA